MKPRGTLTVRHDGKWQKLPLQPPAPVRKGDELVVNTDAGKRSVPKKDVVGWEWDGKTH